MAGEESLGGTPKTAGGTPVLPRLPVQVVEHLHRLLGGDARVEAMVLRFHRRQIRRKGSDRVGGTGRQPNHQTAR